MSSDLALIAPIDVVVTVIALDVDVDVLAPVSDLPVVAPVSDLPVVVPVSDLPVVAPVSDLPVVAPVSDLQDVALTEYNLLVQQLTFMIQHNVSEARILFLMASAIKFLSTFKGLTDTQRSNLALLALRYVINNSSIITPTTKAMLLSTISIFGETVVCQLFIFALDTTTFIKNKLSNCTLLICKKKKATNKLLMYAHRSTCDDEATKCLTRYMQLYIKKPFAESDLINLISASVKFMTKFKNLTGLEKKNIIITVLHNVIAISDNISDEKKPAFGVHVDSIANQLIDLLVQFGQDMSMVPKPIRRVFAYF